MRGSSTRFGMRHGRPRADPRVRPGWIVVDQARVAEFVDRRLVGRAKRVLEARDDLDVVTADVDQSSPGMGSASAAREAGAGKGSAKYWVSCVTRSPVSSMTLTE
jgi:hypothetical protein